MSAISYGTLVLAPGTANSAPYTTSEIISVNTGIARRKIRDVIKKHQSSFESFGKVASYQAPLPSGQTTTAYILNEPQATFLLTLLKNTPVVVAFKQELVRQFYAMRDFLLEKQSPIWQDARTLGKQVRREETDVIKTFVDYATAQGSKHASHYYRSLSTLADRTAGITERDNATVIQLTMLLTVERMIAKEIRAGVADELPYKDIYQRCKERLVAVQSSLTGSN